MSKFCQNCGKELADADRFCDGCGAVQEAAPQPVQQEAAPQQPKASFDFNKVVAQAKPIVDKVKAFAIGVIERCKADKKYMYTCAGIAGGVVVALVLLIVLLTAGGGYTKPIDTLIDVTFKGKVEKITELAPQEYWDYLEEEYEVDIDDIIDQAEDSFDDMMDYYEEEYGDNIRVSYKVEDKKELSSRKLKGIAEALADAYDMDEDDFTAAYELDVEMTIKGSESDDDSDAEITVIKYKGKWYAISWYKSGDEYRASFMTDF